MRKLIASTTAAVLLTAGLAGPAWAATPDAPTDVQVSWTDDGLVHVTWNDTGEANEVLLSSSTLWRVVATTAADAPNEVVLAPRVFPDQDEVRIALRSLGSPKSAPAYSPAFDTHRVPNPTLLSAQSLSGSSVRLWPRQDERVDKTPNDPLDKPAGEWLRAIVTGPAAGEQVEFAIPAGARQADVPVRPGSVTIKLATGNEWGEVPIWTTVRVGTMRASATMPVRASWVGFTINGRVQMSEPVPGEAISVAIQARPNAASAWKTITGTSAQNAGAILPATLGAGGGQEYRLWVSDTRPSRDNVFLLTPPASTTAKFVRRTALVDRAEFYPSRAPAGATVRLLVHAAPEQSMKAALQKWDGKQWRYLRAVQLDAKGNADIPFRAAGRGTATKYRIITPPLKANGLPIDAGTSGTATLKVF